MINPLEIWRDVLSKYKPRKVSGAFWFRAVSPSRKKTILSMDGAFLYGGRYNTPRKFGALYLSRTRAGCIAEIKRRSAYPPRYVLGKIKVYLSKVCDLTDETLLKSLGINREQLTADDWDETQILGEIIRDAGFEGMIVPSAAGDFNNLVVFKDQLTGKSRVELEESTPLDLS